MSPQKRTTKMVNWPSLPCHNALLLTKHHSLAPLNSPGSHSPITPGGQGPSSSNLPFPPPLLRISASPHDSHLLATVSTDSPLIRILDVRQPGQALLELRGHGAAVNCIEWSPNRRGMLASGGDDSTVLIWDLMSQAGAVVPQAPGQQPGGGERGPGAAWACEYEVSNLSWAPVGDTLGVCGGRGFWGVQM
jgi:DDB1- and CUL4-associated factor 7